MKKILWLLLLLPALALAQVQPYPPTGLVPIAAGNVLCNNTGSSATPAGCSSVPGATLLSPLQLGTDQHISDGYPALQLGISLGSAGTPVTNATYGPQLKISRTESYTTGACTSNVDAECAAPFEVVNVGSATDWMQAEGPYFGAVTTSPTSPGAVGLTSIGIDNATGGSRGEYGTGAFLVGAVGGDMSTGASGAEVRVANNTTTACTVNYNTVYQCDGIWFSTSGTVAAGSAMQTATNAKWLEGVTLNNSSVANTGFNDQSSSTTAFKAGSGHTTAWSSPGFTIDGSGNITSTGTGAWSGLNTFNQNSTSFSDPGIVVNNIASGAFVATATFFAPNLTSGQTSSLVLGTALGNDDYASLNYTWRGNGFGSNELGIGLYTASNLLNIFQDGGVTVGAPTGGDLGAGTLDVAASVTANSFGTGSGGRAVNTGTASDTIAASKASTYESANTAAGAFTLTLAAPTGDGEQRRICFKNAVSALTVAVTSPATAAVGMPAVMVAGQCMEVIYNSVSGTPTNAPATSWLPY